MVRRNCLGDVVIAISFVVPDVEESPIGHTSTSVYARGEIGNLKSLCRRARHAILSASQQNVGTDVHMAANLLRQPV